MGYEAGRPSEARTSWHARAGSWKKGAEGSTVLYGTAWVRRCYPQQAPGMLSIHPEPNALGPPQKLHAKPAACTHLLLLLKQLLATGVDVFPDGLTGVETAGGSAAQHGAHRHDGFNRATMLAVAGRGYVLGRAWGARGCPKAVPRPSSLNVQGTCSTRGASLGETPWHCTPPMAAHPLLYPSWPPQLALDDLAGFVMQLSTTHAWWGRHGCGRAVRAPQHGVLQTRRLTLGSKGAGVQAEEERAVQQPGTHLPM